MYSQEERNRAIALYIKYDKSASDVVHELGYPTQACLRIWYKEHLEEQRTGVQRPADGRYSTRYSPEQKRVAVDHYLEHGRRISRTVRALGYPSKQLLGDWIRELAPDMRRQRCGGVQLGEEQKRSAVIDLCSGKGSAKDIAEAYGTRPESLRKWKSDLLGKEAMPVSKESEGASPDERDALLSEIEELKAQIYRLKLEKDILEGAAEIIKKGRGVDLANLSNREKAELIGALRNEYPLSTLLPPLKIARSSYFYQMGALAKPDKHKELRVRVRGIFDKSSGRYGSRRIHAVLAKSGERVSEKVVRRIMEEEGCVAKTGRLRKYSSYQGEVSPAAPNVLKRDFSADAPNTKWLTDITEFRIPAGKIYLSPILDCFDGMAVSWTIGTSPDANLVNESLDCAASSLAEGEHPVVHSDRGAHYRWPGWIERMARYDLTRSMSRKGCSPDNAACEGFFGRLKNEMFYGQSWEGIGVEDFMEMLDQYISWYNEVRIKMSLGAMSPMEYRRSLGYAA
jgi:transposase InsO family protein/transposase-like protein